MLLPFFFYIMLFLLDVIYFLECTSPTISIPQLATTNLGCYSFDGVLRFPLYVTIIIMAKHKVMFLFTFENCMLSFSAAFGVISFRLCYFSQGWTTFVKVDSSLTDILESIFSLLRNASQGSSKL